MGGELVVDGLRVRLRIMVHGLVVFAVRINLVKLLPRHYFYPSTPSSPRAWFKFCLSLIGNTINVLMTERLYLLTQSSHRCEKALWAPLKDASHFDDKQLAVIAYSCQLYVGSLAVSV